MYKFFFIQTCLIHFLFIEDFQFEGKLTIFAQEIKLHFIMIHTQLLKSEKPYQIISAAGMVGIQVATLIVTEEKTAEDGSYSIDTHSHPVVNYASKEGLTEELKYTTGFFDDYKLVQRMQPEGAVWNKVEIRDITVLGLVGAQNFPVDISDFIGIVPSAISNHRIRLLWDNTTTTKIQNLFYSLERVGINISKEIKNIDGQDFNKHYIYLDFIEEEGLSMVKVLIRDDDYSGNFMPIFSAYFKCRLEENPIDTSRTIGHCLGALSRQYEFKYDITFICRSMGNDEKIQNYFRIMTDDLNNNWRLYRSEV